MSLRTRLTKKEAAIMETSPMIVLQKKVRVMKKKAARAVKRTTMATTSKVSVKVARAETRTTRRTCPKVPVQVCCLENNNNSNIYKNKSTSKKRKGDGPK
eukprot:8513974-Ditylum_brightwellii.AAC.1